MVDAVKFTDLDNGGNIRVGDILVAVRGADSVQIDIDDGIEDGSGKLMFGFSSVGSLAVNYLNLKNSNTGTPVTLEALGTDDDVDIQINPKGAGALKLDQITWPIADGTVGQAIVTDGSGTLSFADVTTVTGAVVDERIARFDGTSGDLQNSLVSIDDAGVMTGATRFDVDNLRLDGNTISSIDVDGDIIISPNGTGNVDIIGITISDSSQITGVTNLTVDNINIDGNIISAQNTNGDINVVPNGSGLLIVNGGSGILVNGSNGNALFTLNSQSLTSSITHTAYSASSAYRIYDNINDKLILDYSYSAGSTVAMAADLNFGITANTISLNATTTLNGNTNIAPFRTFSMGGTIVIDANKNATLNSLAFSSGSDIAVNGTDAEYLTWQLDGTGDGRTLDFYKTTSTAGNELLKLRSDEGTVGSDKIIIYANGDVSSSGDISCVDISATTGSITTLSSTTINFPNSVSFKQNASDSSEFNIVTNPNDAGDSRTLSIYRATSGVGNVVLRIRSNVTSTYTRHLDITANGDVTNTNGSYGTISDIRLKENVTKAPSFWNKFKKLPSLIYYNFKNDEEKKRHLGWSAQELEEDFPELVSTYYDEELDGEYLRVGTTLLIPQLCGITLEAQKRIEKSENMIKKLQDKVNKLIDIISQNDACII